MIFVNKKTDVEVMIHNKKYVIAGYESPEYMERIASYINKKQAALRADEGYRTLDSDVKAMLLEVNLADD